MKHRTQGALQAPVNGIAPRALEIVGSAAPVSSRARHQVPLSSSRIQAMRRGKDLEVGYVNLKGVFVGSKAAPFLSRHRFAYWIMDQHGSFRCFTVLILTVNCGSSSLKLDLLDYDPVRPAIRVASVSVAGIGAEPRARARFGEAAAEGLPMVAGSYADIATSALVHLRQRRLLSGLDGAGHRVVHGGATLSAPTLLDSAAMASIEAVTELAPLHNQPALDAIRACREVLGGALPMVATFDTAFFRDLPAAAATYAIPSDLASKLGIHRFGFHGLAHRYMAKRFAQLKPLAGSRLVTLQLGAGCSAAAILAGKPIDTSMGFTPLEGLVMSTRSGDLDPSLPGYLAAKTGLSIGEVEAMLNERSGLAGLSGGTGETRSLLEAEAGGDERAHLALEVFCYRIRKYLGAYAAALGGLDGLVFGGGIGENAPDLRRRICAGFEWLGLELSAERNAGATGTEAMISSDASRVSCYVVAVDEALIIAEDTAACLQGPPGKGQGQ